MLKAKQKKAIEQFYDRLVLRKKNLLAFLPTGYGKSLIYLVLLVKRAANYVSYVSNNASFKNC